MALKRARPCLLFSLLFLLTKFSKILFPFFQNKILILFPSPISSSSLKSPIPLLPFLHKICTRRCHHSTFLASSLGIAPFSPLFNLQFFFFACCCLLLLFVFIFVLLLSVSPSSSSSPFCQRICKMSESMGSDSQNRALSPVVSNMSAYVRDLDSESPVKNRQLVDISSPETRSDGRNTLVLSPSRSVGSPAGQAGMAFAGEGTSQPDPDETEEESQGPRFWEEIASEFTSKKLRNLRRAYNIPDNYHFIVPSVQDRPHLPPKGFVTFYAAQVRAGLRFPIPPLFISIANKYRIPLNQFAPNAIRTIAAFAVLLLHYGHQPTVDLFYSLFLPRAASSSGGVFYLTSRGPAKFLSNTTSDKKWKENYFFVAPPEGVTWNFRQEFLEKLESANPYPSRQLSLYQTQLVAFLNFSPRHANKLVDDRLLHHIGYSPSGADLKGTTLDKLMELSRVQAMISRRKQRGEVEPPLPPPPALVPLSSTPTVSTTPNPAVMLTSPASVQGEPQAAQSGASGKRPMTWDTPPTAPPAKRSNTGITIKDITPDLQIRTSDPPFSRTRSRAGSPPISYLKSQDLDAMADFLQKLPNSTDRYHLEHMSYRKRAEAALIALPKALLAAGQVALDVYNGSEVTELGKKLNKAQDQLKKAQDQNTAREKDFKRLQEDYQDLQKTRKELEIDLANEVANAGVELRKALAEARQSWVTDLPSSAEGIALIAQYKADFLASPEFDRLCDDKNFEFFLKGFHACAAQFKAANVLPPGASTDFLDAETAAFAALAAPSSDPSHQVPPATIYAPAPGQDAADQSPQPTGDVAAPGGVSSDAAETATTPAAEVQTSGQA